MTTNNIFTKDPDAVLDYKFDWAPLTNGAEGGLSDWLASGETISTRTITVSTGLTKDSDSPTDTNTSITVWLSGGTVGQNYTVACEIVTSDSRTDERTITIKVRNR
jgi:hypothetical protein